MTHHDNGKINIIFNEQKRQINTKHSAYILKHNRELKLIDKQFSSFVGLEHFKEIIKEIYATKLMNHKREEMGLTINKQVLHMIFKGNPGTGKTTIARELANVLFKLNILSKGHFIEAERADLVGEYIGQTAQKTRNLVQKALGGILFIDEAYSLARGGHKDFGRESIDTLVKQMEDHHDDFILILAGYPAEMEQFLSLNPGLKSRFPFHIPFPDYKLDQLIDIAIQIANEREYEISEKALWKLRSHLREKLHNKVSHFANARYVRNIIEKSIRMQAIRLLQVNEYTIKELMQLKADDIQFEQ
ncbi:AAA family ATPase [Pseudogracilibacillus sp. SE30717A]|uniref:AAA family ATPase n=1 Tax=Pseudogracilibacillus sp. SE30717A TaxID=3098293 RepID=UPI00300DF251